MTARLGSRATQYSHIVFVHNDHNSGEIKTIESYVGVGVAFYDFDFAIKNNKTRKQSKFHSMIRPKQYSIIQNVLRSLLSKT